MTYLKICLSDSNVTSTINNFLKGFEGKTSSKAITEKFILKNNIIIIDNDSISRQTLSTIKWIDDLVDKFEGRNNHQASIAISENISDLVNGADEKFVIYNPSKKLIEEMSKWSLIKLIKQGSDFVLFDFDFYSALEYSKEINIHTENGMAKMKTAYVKSHDKLFTIFRVGEIKEEMNVRVHYMCETSEIFDSVHCDCKKQLNNFKKYIFSNGGILIFAHEEGRGFGLTNKINAYWNTEHLEMDTVDAMIKEVGESENRMFEIPADIIDQAGIKEINLTTNNPLKINPFIDRGIKVNRIDAWPEISSKEAKTYIETKIKRMEHYEDSDKS